MKQLSGTLCLWIMLFLMSCKPSSENPAWEVTELSDQVRSHGGGSYAALPMGMTHYEISGPDNGPVVILVHGSTLPMWTWDRQVSLLAEGGFRVLRYDHFGRGYSDRPKVEYSIDLYRNQLHDLIQFLGLKKPFSLVGISFGCPIVANYAANYPGDVCRAAFVAPAVDPFNEISKLFAISPLGALLIKKQLKKQVEGEIRNTLHKRGMPDKYADMFIDQATIKGFQRSLISFFHNAALGDYRLNYRKAGEKVSEVMLIWGDDDKTVRKGQIRAFNKAIPKAQVNILNGIGHLAPFEATGQFNELLLSFLKSSTCQ